MASTKQKKKRQVITPGEGPDLVILAGFTRDVSRWLLRTLSSHTTRARRQFVGVPSNTNDSAELYTFSVKRQIYDTLAGIMRGDGIDSVFTPRRIVMLYIPSKDYAGLVHEFGLACFMQPLSEDHVDPSYKDDISWRHDKVAVESVVYQGLGEAINATDALKSEISDKRMSPLSLPARNFCFPTADCAIETTYHACWKGEMSFEQLGSTLTPKRFTREQLAGKAFKGGHSVDYFFQDARGRIFPIDNHGRIRYGVESGSESGGRSDVIDSSDVRRVLEQRYRFGVIVRDGNVHYDVQYAIPRKLNREPMHCADMGEVWVNGSHANVGVNDVIWTPDGSREPRA